MSRARATRASLTTILCVFLAVVSDADDWPQWRGAVGAGSVSGTRLAGAESVELDLAWRRSLGSGYSSVSIEGDLGVTMASAAGRDWVVAVDVASGSELWRFDLGEMFYGRGGSDDGPMSTPALAEGKAYVLSAEGRLVALDMASGSLEWEHRLQEEFGSEPDYYGFSTSPIVDGDRLYLLAGGAENRMLLALDRRTGDVIWGSGSEPVGHQIPALATLAGVEQVVAASNESVAGFAIDDGRQLWRHEIERPTSIAAVVPIDDRRVLLMLWYSMHMLEVEGDGVVREVWSNTALGSTYGVPVRHGDHLYGFKSRFLSCVEIATGEVVWKSRPPSGGSLIAVDDQLVIVSDDGVLVAVEATPAGYRETGRLDLFGRRRVWTPASFAVDRLFVRDLHELVAVDVNALAARVDVAGAETSSVEGEGEIASLLGRLAGEPGVEKAAALEDLTRRFTVAPVIENGAVHFLYRGDEPDLAISGDMSGGHADVAMVRVPGTDWFHRSFPAPTAGRWEYRYKVYEEGRLDPLNARTVVTPGGTRSVVAFGDDGSASPPECAECPEGRVEEHEIESRTPERSYRISVYTPPGYEPDSDERLPVVLWAEGEQRVEFGSAEAWLDALIGRGEIEPLIAVFLQLPEPTWWAQNGVRMAEIMDQDVMPFLERTYPLSAEPADRAIVAQGWSVGNMLLWALDREVGAYALQSPMLGSLFVERDLPAQLDGARAGTVSIDWGTHDQFNPNWSMDVEAESRGVADAFRAAGFEVTARETAGGGNWTRWSAQTGEILRSFFAAK